MGADSVLTVVVALCCVLAIGATSTTLDSTVETDPEEVTDFDYSKVPIGSGQAQKLDDAIDRGRSATGQSGSADDGSPAEGTSGDQQMQASRADPDADEGDHTKSAGSGDGGEPEQRAGSGANEQQRQSAGSGANERRQQSSGSGDEQNRGASSRNDRSGSGAGATDPPLVQQLIWLLRDLLELLLDLIPYLVLATLVAVAVRFRDRILARIAPGAAGRADDAGDEPRPDPDPQNAVSAAWFEMVERLDLDDRTHLTPGECAAAAKRRGADDEAVRDLTALFEEVRYGGARVTDERRERAERTVERLRSQLEVRQ
ncbi:DUF4129 domain-containing protein [Halorussus salinus]|uniref:DUF4129 domain-containing protein n=1 Tax=Halorussus salinus TaxID=1364935 RepID=UPI0010927136|nr:DUF4129 domain-containing protein [Halorussus salinus]